MKNICHFLTVFVMLALTACNFSGSQTCKNTCPENQKQNEDCSCSPIKKLPATAAQQKEIFQNILSKNEQALTKLAGTIAPDSPLNLDNLPEAEEFKNIYARNINIFTKLSYQKDNLTLLSLLAPLDGFNETFNTLLQNGADPNLQAFYGETPLAIAIASDQGEKVKMLLEAGADVNFEGENNILITALNLEKYKALYALASFAKSKQIDFKFPPNYFISAMINNQTNMAIAILPLTDEHVLNMPNNFGTLPLVQAAFLNNQRLIDALLENGANIELKDENQRTPLLAFLQEIYIAKIEGNFPAGREAQITAAVKHFLDKGADINAKDYSGENILFYAVKDNNKPLIDLLITTYKQDLNTRNNDGETPLFTAAQNHPGLVPYLLARGANPKIMDNKGRTPAIAAAEMGNMDIYDLLEGAAATRI